MTLVEEAMRTAVSGIRHEVVFRLQQSPATAATKESIVLRSLRGSDHDLIEEFERDSSGYFLDAERRPAVAAFVADGQQQKVAAIAHSSRRTAQACELGVNTAAWARRRGMGLAVTILWSSIVVEQEKRIPIYSAAAENEASLALARAAGYRPIARATYVSNDSDSSNGSIL
jgi:hypothetical protein